MQKSIIYIPALMFLIMLINSCEDKPENLSVSKSRVVEYYKSGEYENDLKAALEQAFKLLNEQATVKNPTVVFDVDETILSNYDYIKSVDFGYNKELWDEYLLYANAGSIDKTVELYKALIDKNFSVVFITARPQETYLHTFENLKTIGVTEFDTLICKTKEYENVSSAKFKEKERELLTQKGHNIIMCVGDQESDMQGKFTGVKIKLPNKMYLNN